MFCCQSVGAHEYIHSTTHKVKNMKRTFRTILAAAGLAFIGLGSLLTAPPAQAAYVAPYVPSGCTTYTKAGFAYPMAPSAPQYVYCGSNPSKYRDPAGQALNTRLPWQSGTSMLRQKFEAQNITLYVFESAQDAQAKLGTTNIPSSVVQPYIYGVSVFNPAPVGGNTVNRFIAVFEKYLNSGMALVPTETTIAEGPANDPANNRFLGAVLHESGHIMDNLVKLYPVTGGDTTKVFSDWALVASAYTKDKNVFDAKNTCSLFPVICSGSPPTVTNPLYVGKSNTYILSNLYGYQRYFLPLTGTGVHRELIAEETAMTAYGYHGGISNKLDDWVTTFGTYQNSCTALYTSKLFSYWRLPTSGEKAGGSCP